MGEVVELAGRRRPGRWGAGRRMRPWSSVEFLFDLADPWTYLMAERIERAFAGARWTPASAAALTRRPGALGTAGARCSAEGRARALRLPLEWPDRYPCEVPAAMRAAAYASERGRGAAFALAAGRLAFCGGFDLDDPEVIAEAAAAAGVGLDETLSAARDAGRDAEIDAAGRRLLRAGAATLPVLRSARGLACGEPAISAVTAAAGLPLAAT